MRAKNREVESNAIKIDAEADSKLQSFAICVTRRRVRTDTDTHCDHPKSHNSLIQKFANAYVGTVNGPISLQ